MDAERILKAWEKALEEIEEKDKEIERLRKALEKIIFVDGGTRYTCAYDIAKETLKED